MNTPVQQNISTNKSPEVQVNYDDLEFGGSSTPVNNNNSSQQTPQSYENDLDMLDFANKKEEESPQNNFNLDYLENTSQPKLESSLSLEQEIVNEFEDEEKDNIWLNENEMDNQGKNGIRVSGRWEKTSNDEVYLVFIIFNKSSEELKTPRFDIRKNRFGFLFDNFKTGISLDSVKPDKKRSWKKKIIHNGIANKSEHENYSNGDLEIILGSGFDEFEFNIPVPIKYILLNENISEDEYRNVWREVPKEEHVQYNISLPYSKIVEGNYK